MNILNMSFSGTLFILAVMMIRTAAKNSLPKMTFPVLWEMVLLRLILPFTVPSVFSIYTLINRSMSTPPFSETDTDTLASAISQELSFIVHGAKQPTANAPSVSVWFVVWCAGMILLAAFFTVSYLRCLIEFRTALPVSNAYASQWLEKHPLKRRLSIRQSDKISTPLTYGIFRPVILMPKQTDWENANWLQYIFTHEYVHICRFDVVTKLIAAFALCIHWFNPLVWAMYILFSRDIELACDESVIKQFGEKSKSAYSLMLISLEAKKSGLPALCNNFSKNAVEERIAAIQHAKRVTPITLFSACLIVFVTVSLFATSATASTDGKAVDSHTASCPKTDADDTAADKKNSMTIIHKSADILCYDDGAPYIHDILTNHTDKTIIETQYCMLAYNENGSPLKLYWNFLDSSAERSYENIVRTETNILSGQTEEYRGGWSLYDGEIMEDFPKVGNGEANQAAYALLCLQQVVFEDGTVWNNPNYANWFETYAGKETGVKELRDYYPHEYLIQ